MTASSTPSSVNATSRLAVRGICKGFAGVQVLKNMNFDVRAAEIHALCGGNGAGKSTLMKILAGVHRPNSGEITLGEKTFNGFSNAHVAQLCGVGIVFQERSLFGPLTGAENIFAGRQPVSRFGIIDRRRLHQAAAALLEKVAPEIAPNTPVSELSPAQQQMVEIAKAPSLDAKVMILDEPTAALTEVETARLFELIRQLRSSGHAIIYISHRLEEIFDLADRVTVLKDGEWQGTMPVSETDTQGLIHLMVGRVLNHLKRPPSMRTTRCCWMCAALVPRLPQAAANRCCGMFPFHCAPGEIVGLAGLAGAGLEPQEDKGNTAEATRVASGIIQGTTDLVAMAGFDSESGPSMAQAIKEAGKTGKIIATCVEAEEPHLRFLKEGVLTACVGQKRELFTYIGVRALYEVNHSPIKFTNNDKVAGVSPIASNYDTGTYTVTQENVVYFLRD